MHEPAFVYEALKIILQTHKSAPLKEVNIRAVKDMVKDQCTDRLTCRRWINRSHAGCCPSEVR